MDDKILKTLRMMAWQRAVGELEAYLQTFWPEYDKNGKAIDNGFEDASRLIEKFVLDFNDIRR